MKIKYFIVGILLSIVFPAITNAAKLSLESVSTTEKNIVKYNIVYDPKDTTETSIKIEANKTDNGLIYQFGNIKEGILGDCNNQNLSCTINVQDLTEPTTLTELKITNNTENDINFIPSLLGTYQVTLEAITIKALPKTTTTTTTTTRVLSSDSTLSNITISTGIFDQTFNKDITEYNITEIKDTVNSVYITPTCDYCEWQINCPTGDCKVENKKKVIINKGANQIAIVVTSEDKTASQTYILNVYKGEIEEASPYLTTLTIEGIDLSPNFETLTNDYSANLNTDLTELNITAIPKDPKAKVEIKGNKDLKDGENTITITVTSSDEKNKQVYTLIVTKEVKEVEENDKEETNIQTPPITEIPKKKNNTLLIVIIAIATVILITIIGILIFKKNKKKNKDDNNDKNDKGNNITKEEVTKKIIEENTESLNILNETKKELYEEPKQDIDEALDDLMKTKRLELGELDF